MAYLTELTPRHMAALDPVLKRLPALAEDQTITIGATSPQALSQLRFLFYSYLHLTGQKRAFRVRTVSHRELSIRRLPANDNFSFSVEKNHSFSSIEQFVREHLLDLLDEEQVQALCAEHGLSSEDTHLALSEWRRVQGH